MALQIAAQMPGVSMTLFKLISANMNVTTDQVFTPLFGLGTTPLQYLIDEIRCTNASTSLDTAAGGIYTAITKPAGGIIVAAAQAYSALTDSTLGLNLTLAALGLAQRTTLPYLSLTTAQGAAATADFYVRGRILIGV